jgi:glycosyltransferase involved in cell wall biosynthesis
MKISGCTIVKDGIKLAYPFIEAIKSILPVCDEVVVGVGKSSDDTKSRVSAINDPKIKVFETVWDTDKRRGGLILSEQTNIAMEKCGGDWIFYIQADEVFHENGIENLKRKLGEIDDKKDVDGLYLAYKHFYGSYFTVQTGRNWYKDEVRVVRNNAGIKSHGDAQGFRKNGGKIHAVNSGAEMYHYGWARPPEVMIDKIKSFHRFWHDDEWISRNCAGKGVKEFFSDLGNLKAFSGTHPKVMHGKINHDYDGFINTCREQYLKQRNLSDSLRDFFRSLPIGQHRNFN